MLRSTLRPSLPLLFGLALTAAEPTPVPPPVVAPAPAPAPAPSLWTNEGRIGFFFNNTTTGNADISRDPTIGGAGATTAVLGSVDYKALWAEDKDSVDHIFKGRYGRQRAKDSDFTENEDEARYDGVYRRELRKPHFIYLGWGAETVWTGPHRYAPTLPPDNSRNPFDPLLVKVSGGYGQRYADLAPEDKLEWRIGARAQKHWGSQLSEDQRGIETGIEAFLRYEGAPVSYHKDLKYFIQYEGFSEFNDLQHVTNLITSGLTFQLAKYLNLELALRAYYETRPKEDRDDKLLPGYNVWSIKQDTLIGVVYNF